MACSVELSITNLVFLGVLFCVGKKLLKIFLQWRVDHMTSKWDNSPKDKVILHTVGRGYTVPSPSPFSLKLETYLRMAKIPYDLDAKTDARGPKGKFPWMTYNGVHVADTHLCIQYLNQKLGINLNKNAPEEQLAVARSCRVMLEEHFFWGLAQFRIVDNIAALPTLIKIPKFLRPFLPIPSYMAKKRLQTIGIGLHTPSEIYQMTEDDLHVASDILGNRKFFGGEQPCEEDAAIFGQVAQAVWCLPGSGYERLVHGELRNLKEYCERMKSLFWPDWVECLDKRN